jgi:hypothetical protein
MVLVALAGAVVVWGRGFDLRLPAEIRAMAAASRQPSSWRLHQCLLDLGRDTSFAKDCADQSPRPLVFVWGDSTAAALMPGLRKAQETRNFGIAQFTSTSCIPALNADIPGNPNCRAVNDKVMAIAREIRPDIVLLQGTWQLRLDNVAQTVTALKQTHRRTRGRAGTGPVLAARAAERSAALLHAAAQPDSDALHRRHRAGRV